MTIHPRRRGRDGEPFPGARRRAQPVRTSSAHPASHLLAQTHLLLQIANAILTGAQLRAYPPPLDRSERSRMASWLAEISGWVELHCSPANLPTSSHLAPGLFVRMNYVSGRVRRGRHQLAALAADADGGADHSVIPPIVDAACTLESAWIITQTRAYQRQEQISEVSAHLADITRAQSGVAEAAARQVPGGGWRQAAAQLNHTFHCIHDLAAATANHSVKG